MRKDILGDDASRPVRLQFEVGRDGKCREYRTVTDLLLHDLVARDLSRDIGHPVHELVRWDVVLWSSPLSESLHLAHCERQQTVRVLEVFVLENVDNRHLGTPNVELFPPNLLAALQNQLLGGVKLRHEGCPCIAGRVCLNLLLNVLCQLQILLNLALHLQARVVRLVGENLHYLHRVFRRYDKTAFGSSETPLVLHAKLPVAFGHVLVEIKRLPIVASEETQTHLVLCLGVRPANLRAQLPLLILYHLLTPLGLGDGVFGELAK